MYPIKQKNKVTITLGFNKLYPLTAWYRKRGLIIHRGVDIGPYNPSDKIEVIAPVAGRVFYAGIVPGYGYTCIIEYNDPKTLEFHLLAHLAEVYVKGGESVAKGDIIALMGNSGNSSGKHTHYEVRKLDFWKRNLIWIDPSPYMT